MHVKECIVSAPGKAILHGEHAVVHGKVSITTFLNEPNIQYMCHIERGTFFRGWGLMKMISLCW